MRIHCQSIYVRQMGMALLPVAIIIAVVASVAFLISSQSAMNVNNIASHNESSNVEYVTQAALQHAIWKANESNCADYSLDSTVFNDNSYSAIFSPTDLSPVTISATGVLANGISRTITRGNIPIYNPLTQTVILQPGSEGIDSFIEGESGHYDHNKKNDKYLEETSVASQRDRILIKFDLSTLPLGVIVDSAVFEIYLDWKQGPNRTVEAHALTRDWTEDGVTWNSYDGTTAWQTAGGDYEETIAASFDVSGIGWNSFNITNLAQGWASNKYPNYGIILLSPIASSNQKYTYLSSDSNDPVYHPKLTITYKCECGVGPCELPPSKEPIVHLKLDETSGSTAIDSEGNYDGSLMNGPSWNSGGQEGGALKFDEANDYVELKDVDFRTDFTISFGIKIDDNSGSLFQYMYSHGDINNTNSLNIFLNEDSHGTDPNKLRTVIRDANDTLSNTALEFDVSSIIGDGFWHTYTLTVANGVGADVYLDGVLQNSDSRGGDDFDPETELYLGARQDLSSGRYYGGLLDNVRIYEYALSAEEVAELATPPVLLPKAHWKLDETSGLVARDSAGGHDGTLENGPVWSTDGKINGTLYFDGVNDQIIVPHSDELSFTKQFTMSAWINNTSASISNSYRIISKESSGSNDNYWMSLQSGWLWMGIGGQYFSPGIILSPNQWYHVAGTYDSDTAEVNMYIDSVKVLTQSISSSLNPNDANIVIGSNWEGFKWWEGFIDDVRLYDHVLTEADVLTLASGGEVGGGSPKPPVNPPADSCVDNFSDEFNARVFSNNDGSKPWASAWLEVNESNGPTSGDIQVRSDLGHNYVLRIRDNDGGGEGVQREVDISNYTTAILNFTYSRNSLDGKSDYVHIDASSDGGSTWTEVSRIEGPGTDDTYLPFSKDISSFISNNTRIRFISSSTLGGTDEVYFDNIEIAVSGCIK